MTAARGIYLRLIVPLGLILLLAMLIAWAIAVKLLTDTIDRRLDEQLDHATAILAAGEFPLSPELIGRLDRLIEARIALLEAEGGIALSTGEADAALDGLVAELDANAEVALVTRSAAGTRWRIAIRPLDVARDSRYAYVAALASLDASRQAARDAAKSLAIAMLIVTVVLAWVGHYFTTLAQQSRRAGVGDLASRVAHEIRNPLTAIKMQLQLLEEQSDKAQAARIRGLLNEIRRMEHIVESALTLGAPVDLEKRRIAVDELVREVLELLRPTLEHRGIDIDLRAGAAIKIDADPDRLKQVLINLVNNAADELGDGGTVRVSTSVDDTALRIVVEDSGPGLRRPAGGSDKPFGLGLGLTICREIVALHEGRLGADSSPELGGARFTIDLPLPIIAADEQTS